jgi:hypothetical protein
MLLYNNVAELRQKRGQKCLLRKNNGAGFRGSVIPQENPERDRMPAPDDPICVRDPEGGLSPRLPQKKVCRAG